MEYSIVNYDELYRPYDKAGRELVYATWVKLPAKPKGDGLQALLEQQRGLEVFGIWCLLLEKTTKEKPENRGRLLNHREEPATIQEIAKSISLQRKEKLVEYALNTLATMGWVKCEHNEDTTTTPLLKSPEQSRVEKSRVEKSNIICIFDFWNSFKGQKNWKSHREVAPEIDQAIQQRLKQYTPEQLREAIRNYADVLLSNHFVWSKNWTLREFLTRHRPDDRNELQLYRFLQNNFSPDDFKRTATGESSPADDRINIRKQYTEKITEATEEKLIDLRKNKTHKAMWFLIDELKPEILKQS